MKYNHHQSGKGWKLSYSSTIQLPKKLRLKILKITEELTKLNNNENYTKLPEVVNHN